MAFIGAALIRIIYAIIFDFSIASESLNIFTGISGFLIHVGIIMSAIYLSYLWPAVTEKVVQAKDEALKDKREKHLEAEEIKTIQKAEPPIVTQKKPPEPEVKTKKDDPNDILNDYLK